MQIIQTNLKLGEAHKYNKIRATFELSIGGGACYPAFGAQHQAPGTGYAAAAFAVAGCCCWLLKPLGFWIPRFLWAPGSLGSCNLYHRHHYHDHRHHCYHCLSRYRFRCDKIVMIKIVTIIIVITIHQPTSIIIMYVPSKHISSSMTYCPHSRISPL